MRLRFNLKDILYSTVIIALLLGWHVDRNALNDEAASLTTELYKFKSRLRASTLNYGGLLPPQMASQYTKRGDTINARTSDGRQLISNRLRSGDLDFLIANPSGDPLSGIDGPGWEMRTLEDFRSMGYGEASRFERTHGDGTAENDDEPSNGPESPN